jgi:hypothetical protein
MVPWHIQAATRPSIKYLLPLQQHSTNPAAEPGRSRRKTPRRVARIASPRHRWSTTGRLAAGSAGWASGSSRPAVHALLSGLFFFFFPEMFWLCTAPIDRRCKHYRRRCRIRAPCCNDVFHCHNEATVRPLLCIMLYFSCCFLISLSAFF